MHISTLLETESKLQIGYNHEEKNCIRILEIFFKYFGHSETILINILKEL